MMRNVHITTRNYINKLIIILIFYNIIIMNILAVYNQTYFVNSNNISIKKASYFSPIKWDLNWSILSPKTNKWSIDIGDLTKNIKEDIVCGLDIGNISVFNKNKLNTTLLLSNNYTTLVLIADLNADSNNELICANGNNLSIFQNLNGLSLIGSILVSQNISVLKVENILKEISGTEIHEIIIGDEIGNVSIWQFNFISKSFSLIQSIKFSDKITGLAISDFTANRNMDLAVTTDNGNFTLLWWNWEPKLVIAYTTIISTSANNFQIYDINIDGGIGVELITSDSSGNISIWKNVPGIAVLIIETCKINLSILTLDITDLNHDGVSEILVGTSTGNVSIWTYINENLKMISSIITEINVTGLIAGNMDEDSFLEIIVGSKNNLSIYDLIVPDLKITAFSIDKILMNRGDYFTITVNISNVGDYTAKNISVGVYWDIEGNINKLGNKEVIPELKIGNLTSLTITVSTSGRNVLYHWIIVKVNDIYSVLESDMNTDQEEMVLIRLISLDWIWVILIVSGLLVVVFIGIFILPKKGDDDDDRKKTRKFVKKV
ncbi:MAG: CARDB domain-containing protein [Candidatus Helarchaeota archaeon]